MSDPRVSDASPDSSQVLYNLAMGAQPQDFPPALQSLAQGYGALFQPQPAQTPGLLGSPDDIQAAIAQAAPAPDEDAAADSSPADGNDGDDQDDDDDDDQNDDDQGGDGQSAAPAAPDPVQRLKDAQKAALANRLYKPGNHVTHCNQATYDIAQRMGVNVAPLQGPSGAPALANAQVDNLEKAASTPGSGWRKIDGTEAQGYANQGKMVILGWKNPAGGAGHTASVSPDSAGVASNPSVAQIGVENKMTNFRGSFGREKRNAVGAYVYDGR